jgi:Fe2+ transport system protein FeoA
MPEAETRDQLAIGHRAVVTRINGQGALRRRIMDMGITPGAEIEMVKTSPLGDPVEYLVRGYHLSLRRSEAQMIEIEMQPDADQ